MNKKIYETSHLEPGGARHLLVSGLDLGMGRPTRRTRTDPPEKNPTRPGPRNTAGGSGP